MAKKKRPVTKASSQPARPIPAMYPEPEPIKLATPLKITAIDPKTNTFAVEDAPPPEMAEWGALEDWLVNVVAHDPNTNKFQYVLSLPPEKEKRRLNLQERLQRYAQNCISQIGQHWEERPKHIPPAKWQKLEDRADLIAELPEAAPAEARVALLALQTLNRLLRELNETGNCENPESVKRAIGWAIDLGQLLQCGKEQIDFGKIVDIERKSAKARPLGPQKVSADAKDRTKLIRQRFIEIRDEGILKGQQDIIDKMLAPKTLTDGKGNMSQVQPKLPDGSDMPARSTIEKATVGLTPRKSPTKSKRK